MLAGLIIPGSPVGNMYFALWSHNIVQCAVDLCSAMKKGNYRKYHQLIDLQVNPDLLE